MNRLKVFTIGCDDDLLTHVRRELASLSVHLEHEFPDARGAIAALRSVQGDKRLLILHLKSAQENEELKRLGAAFGGWPILALVDADDQQAASSETVLKVIRAGAGQVVLLPLRADDFKEAMDCFAAPVVHPARDKKVIAVAGVTGGCGGTTLAVNLAYEFAQMLDQRCILADLSLNMGTIATSLNVEPTYTIQDLLKDVRQLDVDVVGRVLVKISDNLQILAGPVQIIAPPPNPPQDVLHVVDLLQQMADVVVLDLSTSYNDFYFEILAKAGQVVLVCEQKVPSIRALKLVREALGRSGADDWEFLVINRYDPKIQGFTMAALSKILPVTKWHTIADDTSAVVACLNHGLPLRLQSPRSRVLTDIDVLACALLGLGAHHELKPKGPGILKRMHRAFTHS